MDNEMTISLEQELVADLSAELEITDKNFSENLLLSKVRSAIREVYNDRGYPDSYSEIQKNKDLYEQYDKIRKRALYDYSQIGAYGESGHSENSTSRSWQDRIAFCGTVIKIAKM